MPVRPWFFAIVANQCRNVRRTPWFRLTSLVEVVSNRPAPEPQVEHLDLEHAMQKLPVADRGALFMHFYLGLSIEEVATTLGVSTAAAKSRIYRACRRLRPGVALEELG
jgi:RNA polymerase sigma-70 factor (ECF subfamily)